MIYLLVFVFLFIGAAESIRHRKLTMAGGIGGGVIGLLIFIGAAWTGLLMLAAFFVLGTVATAWKRDQKKRIGLAQERGGQRSLGQVVANGGVAGLLGLVALFLPQAKAMLSLLMAGAFSAAMADTLSSELGSVYGKRFYNIITLRPDIKGLDGVVSLEGFVLGIAGSSLIAAIYCFGFGWSPVFFRIVVAGTIGNIVDSLLGATLERKGITPNDVVNLLNTATGALTAWLLS